MPPLIRISYEQYDELITRLEKLELLAQQSGDMLLFFVEVSDFNFLIAAPNFESVHSYLPKAGNIDYVGRASSQYKEFRIIKQWRTYNWDEEKSE